MILQSVLDQNLLNFVDKNFFLILSILFLGIIAGTMIIPLIIDVIYVHKANLKFNTSNKQTSVLGIKGLNRTLMTFGFVLLIGTIIFFLISMIAPYIDKPNNENLQSLVAVLRHLSLILGTGLATIVAFYFGVRGPESAVEKASSVILAERSGTNTNTANPIPSEESVSSTRTTANTHSPGLIGS